MITLLTHTNTVTALPFFSLATTMPLRRRRSPPAAPDQPRHHSDGAFALLDEIYHLPLVDLVAVVSSGQPDSETLAPPHAYLVIAGRSWRCRLPAPPRLDIRRRPAPLGRSLLLRVAPP
jgi:hypothetical protein